MRKLNRSNFIQRYNVKMIQDFLEHLKWELRIVHFELSQKNQKIRINPELVEQLGKYVKKWHTAGLMSAYIIKTDDFSPEEAEELHNARKEQIEKAIKAFDELENIFKDSFWCAEHPKQVPAIQVTADGLKRGFIDPREV